MERQITRIVTVGEETVTVYTTKEVEWTSRLVGYRKTETNSFSGHVYLLERSPIRFTG